MRGVLRQMWDRGKEFIKKAGTIIALASAVIWILQSTSWSFQFVETQDSILASIGRFIAPLFAPLGFGTWQVAIATITGLLAKETIVATFGIVLGLGGGIAEGDVTLLNSIGAFFTPLSAYSFMIFTVFAVPCVAAIGATRREMQSAKWTWATILFQFGFAYTAALLVSNWASLFYLRGRAKGATIIVGLIVFALLGFIAYRTFFSKKKGGGCHSSACGFCPYACDKKEH